MKQHVHQLSSLQTSEKGSVGTLHAPLCHCSALHNHSFPHPLRPCPWVLHKERHGATDGVKVYPKLVQTLIKGALELDGAREDRGKDIIHNSCSCSHGE